MYHIDIVCYYYRDKVMIQKAYDYHYYRDLVIFKDALTVSTECISRWYGIWGRCTTNIRGTHTIVMLNIILDHNVMLRMSHEDCDNTSSWTNILFSWQWFVIEKVWGQPLLETLGECSCNNQNREMLISAINLCCMCRKWRLFQPLQHGISQPCSL